MLLPNRRPPAPWRAARVVDPAAALGLVLADPLLHVARAGAAMRAAGLRWVCGFPSVAQHEPAFQQRLEDVGLGASREREAARRLREHGVRPILCVSTPDHAAAAAAAGAAGLLIAPTTAVDAPAPPLADRCAAIRGALGPSRPPVFALATETDALRPERWPDGLDGVFAPPRPLS